MKIQTIIFSIIFFITLSLSTACDPTSPSFYWEPGWRTGEVHFTWLEENNPYYFDLEYQFYLLDLNSDIPLVVLDRVSGLTYSYLPDIEGLFLIGIYAIKIFDDTDDIADIEGAVCWSDDIMCVNHGNIFYLEVSIDEESEYPDSLRWKIVWL